MTERLSIAISKPLIRAIDDWRRTQPEIPTRAAAARMLIEAGIAADAKQTPAAMGRAARREREMQEAAQGSMAAINKRR